MPSKSEAIVEPSNPTGDKTPANLQMSNRHTGKTENWRKVNIPQDGGGEIVKRKIIAGYLYKGYHNMSNSYKDVCKYICSLVPSMWEDKLIMYLHVYTAIAYTLTILLTDLDILNNIPFPLNCFTKTPVHLMCD